LSNLSVLKLEISSSRYLLILGVIVHFMALIALSESERAFSFSYLLYGLIVINFIFFVFKDVLIISGLSWIELVYKNGGWLLHRKDGKEQSYLSCRCLLNNSIFTLIELKSELDTKRLILFSDQITLEKAHQLQVVLKN